MDTDSNPLRTQVGGQEVHVGDAYVWAEIYYLDSRTDYRECLPENARKHIPILPDNLIMLDSGVGNRSSETFLSSWGIVILCALIAFLLLWGLITGA